MTFATNELIPYLCLECQRPIAADQPRCPGCQALRPSGGWPLDPWFGKTIAGRFRLLERIGSGGMSVVYRARDEAPSLSSLEKGELLDGVLGEVVVKLLAPLSGGFEMRRFLSEVKAARLLANPHSVKIYDCGLHEGQPFLVMERLEGMTLRQLLVQQGPQPIPLTVEVALQVAEALEEVHSAAMIHRDIKPENLMLVGQEQRFVKVLDFGAARLNDINATQSFIGTPRYMSPEQLRQEPLDGRADIYSLGACLFEMLVGKPPFTCATLADCIESHLHAPVPKLGDFVHEAPLALVQLITQMLAKDCQSRPVNMVDVKKQLHQLQQSLDKTRERTTSVAGKNEAPPPNPTSFSNNSIHNKRLLKQRRFRIGFGAISGVILIGALYFFRYQAGAPPIHQTSVSPGSALSSTAIHSEQYSQRTDARLEMLHDALKREASSASAIKLHAGDARPLKKLELQTLQSISTQRKPASSIPAQNKATQHKPPNNIPVQNMATQHKPSPTKPQKSQHLNQLLRKSPPKKSPQGEDEWPKVDRPRTLHPNP